MPISEDEVEQGYGSHQSQMHSGVGTMSKAEQRRSNKPIMEKRRRARINHCLNELKSLILDAMNKDPARHSKLEKADILEMTVKHLQTIQQQQLSLAAGADPTVVRRFQSGFRECAGEVGRYIGRMDGVEPGVKQRLVNHLSSCVSGLQQIAPSTLQANSSGSQIRQSSEDVNNNTASARLQMMTGLQLIPSRLPTGELALLLPNSQHLPFFPPPLDNQVSTTSESPGTSSIEPSHTSAFTAVNREKTYLRSPPPSPTSTTISSYGEESCDRPFPSPGHLPEVTSTSENSRTDIDFSLRRDTNEPHLQHFSDFTKDVQNQNFPSFVSSVKTTQIQPLTVITSDEMLKAYPQRFTEARQNSYKDPLDYSVKKDSFPLKHPAPCKRTLSEEPSDKFLLKTTDFQPPLKVQKSFRENVPQNNLFAERRSLFEIQNKSPSLKVISHQQNNETSFEGKSFFEIQNQPSTSSSEVSRDMWRPW